MADAKGAHDFATAATATGPSAPAEPALPTVDPGHYVRGAEIARGGMGRVVAARDTRLGREVAVKELLSLDDAARFEREALISARLQHPGIVAIYEAGRWPTGEPFYAMKRVIGDPLDKVIARSPTLDERLALIPNVLAVFDALAYAHQQQFIHRDLKPANVLVGDYGETVVIDWGLAKDLRDTTTDSPAPTTASGGDTVAGAVMGTPAYMPPEQARGERVDMRADVYSLGAVLYHVLARQPPHTGPAVAAILHAAIHDTPARLPVGVPVDLVAIVDKAMARDPDQRYPSAKELAQDLRRFQTGQLVGAHAYTRGELMRRWLKRNHRPVSVAAVMLVASGAALGYAVVQIANERDRAVASEASKEQALADSRRELHERIVTTARETIDRDPTRALATLAKLLPDPDPQALVDAWVVASALAAVPVAASVSVAPSEPYISLLVAPGGDVLAIDSRGNVDRWHGTTRRRLPFTVPGRIDTIGERAFLSTGEAFRDMPSPAIALTSDGATLAWSTPSGLDLWALDGDVTRTLAIGQGTVCAVSGARIRVGDRCVDTAANREVPCDPAPAHASTDVVCRGSFGMGSVAVALDGDTLGLGADSLPFSARAAVFSPNGRRLVVEARDGRVYGWSAGDQYPHYLAEGGGPTRFAVSDRGRVAIAMGRDVAIADLDRRTFERIPNADASDVLALAFSHDGDWLYTTGRDRTLRTWHADPGRVVDVPGSSSEEYVGHGARAIAWSSRTNVDDTTTAYASVVELPSGTVRRLVAGPSEKEVHELVATAVDERALTSAAIYEPGRLYVTDLGSGATRELVRREGVTDASLAFDAGATHLLELEVDALHVWDLATGRARDIPFRARAAAWLPDGRIAVLAATSVSVVDGTTVAPIVDVGPGCTSIAASRDGGELVLACDLAARIVDLDRRTVRALQPTHGHLVRVGYGTDGRVVAGSEDGAIQLWTHNVAEPVELTGPTAYLHDVRADQLVVAHSKFIHAGATYDTWVWDPHGNSAGISIPTTAELEFAFDAGVVVEIETMNELGEIVTHEGRVPEAVNGGHQLVIFDLPPHDASGLQAWIRRRTSYTVE